MEKTKERREEIGRGKEVRRERVEKKGKERKKN